MPQASSPDDRVVLVGTMQGRSHGVGRTRCGHPEGLDSRSGDGHTTAHPTEAR